MKAPRLKILREERALSQGELATMAHLSRSTVNQLEGGGESHPSTIRQLAMALEVKPSELTRGQA